MITNKHNLPQSIVDAVTFDNHKSADYSVTQILKDPKEILLTKRHQHEVDEDASEKIWALFGTAVHSVLERQRNENCLVEEYLTTEVHGKKVSGTLDLYQDKTIQDYKTVSVWGIVYKSQYKKWEEQLNCYAYMLREQGFDVEKIQVVAIIRDWQKSKSKFDPTYPQSQVVTIDLPLWAEVSTDDEMNAKDFISMKVREIEKRIDLADDEIEPCLPESRWKRPDVYKCIKGTNKKSSRNLPTEKEAQEWIDKQDKGTFKIEFVKGADLKCAEYCSVNCFCNYYKDSQNV